MSNYINLFCFFALCFVVVSLFGLFFEEGPDDGKSK